MCARGSPVPAARFQGGGGAWTLCQGCSGGKGARVPRVSWQVRDAGSQGGAGAPDLLQALEHPARPPHPTWSSRHVGGMLVALSELEGNVAGGRSPGSCSPRLLLSTVRLGRQLEACGKSSSSARIVAVHGKAGRESHARWGPRDLRNCGGQSAGRSDRSWDCTEALEPARGHAADPQTCGKGSWFSPRTGRVPSP